jgi:hypothetical protein
LKHLEGYGVTEDKKGARRWFGRLLLVKLVGELSGVVRRARAAVPPLTQRRCRAGGHEEAESSPQ